MSLHIRADSNLRIGVALVPEHGEDLYFAPIASEDSECISVCAHSLCPAKITAAWCKEKGTVPFLTFFVFIFSLSTSTSLTESFAILSQQEGWQFETRSDLGPFCVRFPFSPYVGGEI